MSDDTFNSRAPSLPMPTIQNSIGAPAAVRGVPWRTAVSCSACASAASRAASASQVIAEVTVASGASSSTSITANRSMTRWRAMRSDTGSAWPRSVNAWISAPIEAASGAPGASSANASL